MSERRKKKDESVSGSVAAVAVVGGAALAAGLFYGAKKLYEFVSAEMEAAEKQEKMQKEEAERERRELILASQREENEGVRSRRVDGADPSKLDLNVSVSKMSFCDALQVFHQRHAVPNENKARECNVVLEYVMKYIDIHWPTSCYDKIDDVALFGSYDDGTAINSSSIDLILPLVLDSNLWDFLVTDASSQVRISCKNTSQHAIGTSAWDQLSSEGDLSADEVCKVVRQVLFDIPAQETFSFCSLDSKLAAIRVTFGDDEQHSVVINVVPSFTFGKMQLIARDGWTVCHYKEEKEMLCAEGCQRKVLQILKCICLVNAQRLNLSTHILRNQVLSVMEIEEDWPEAQISERLLDCLLSLQSSLRNCELSSRFTEKNIMENYDADICKLAAQFIDKKLRPENLTKIFSFN